MNHLGVEEIHRRILPAMPTREDFRNAEDRLLQLPQVDCPLQHRFAPGVYVREIEMPADTFIIGGEHKTEHFNIVLTGKALVMMDGVVHEITAPTTFVSGPGVRKTLYILETMRWQTIHANPDNEQDIDTLEHRIVTETRDDVLQRVELAALRGATQPPENQTYEQIAN